MNRSMLSGTFTAALALSAAQTFGGDAQSTGDPRLGAWDEQKTSTHFDSLRRVFEPARGGMTRMILNAKLDPQNRQHVDFRCDGNAYAFVTADDRPTGLRYRCHLDANGIVDSTLSGESPGQRIDTTVREVLSTDRNALSMQIAARTAEGRIQRSERRFVRRPEVSAAR